ISKSTDLRELIGRVAEDRSHPAAVVVRIDEGGSLDAIPALPTDGERGIGFLDVDRLALAGSRQSCREPVGRVQLPGIAASGGNQEQLTDRDDAAVVIGRVALNVAHLIGQTKILAPDDLLAGSAPGSFATLGGSWGGCHGIIHPAVR